MSLLDSRCAQDGAPAGFPSAMVAAHEAGTLTEPVQPTLPTLLREAGARFTQLLSNWPGVQPQPAPVLPPHPASLRWDNAIFSGPLLRRAHVEQFEVRAHFCVLHVCIFPHITDPSPIFGFDMIGGHSQATGAFLDFSSTTEAAPVPALREAVPDASLAQFARRRDRPDWGSIFSPDFLAIRPDSVAEARAVIALAEHALGYYLDKLGTGNEATRSGGDGAPARGQAAYVRAQRRNLHTFRMLARYTSEVAARHFIDNVLFPMPGETG